ncbi:hypothetical protein G5I_06948 [Acromyrmex echinatior]|uniref:Uncharacterized protein n=1 Tax=Acromyrmex echinatior TaxID=103372 RepID=F4WMB4_ACREC|nr:hypothetical protein G5I_06948 [Acromyrmex echinatior]
MPDAEYSVRPLRACDRAAKKQADYPFRSGYLFRGDIRIALSGQMSGGTPTMNGTTIGVGGPRAPGDMNNNGLSGPALGPVKPPPMSMQAPTS